MRIEQKMVPGVADVAMAILNEQSFVPMSPASHDQTGKVCLCAAGILAKAGLQVLHGTARAQEFEAELAGGKDPGLLDSTFATLGWPTELCHEMRTTNDVTAEALRPRMIRSYLRKMS